MIKTAYHLYRVVKSQEPSPPMDQPTDQEPATPTGQPETQPPQQGIKPGEVGETSTLISNAFEEYLKQQQKAVIQFISGEIEKNIAQLKTETGGDSKLDSTAWEMEIMKYLQQVQQSLDKGLV